MKKFLALLLSAIMLVSMISIAGAASEPVRATFVDTTGGKVQGYRYDGVDNYFAIQYGTAERFQEAVPYTWQNVRVCNVMGEIAPQSTIDTAARDMFNCFPVNLLQVQSEKLCLQLNVWTPESNANSARPVIVWLHGGGYTTGSSTQFTFYLGEQQAKQNDVVFVSVNHRLNSLGFLDVSAYGGEEYAHSANVGILDIQLALKWIQDNIASFGGDPSNVTIVGQSGGGGKVTSLMSMPGAQGLFQKAVMLSGGSATITRTSEKSQAEAATLVESLGLTGKSNEEIMDALLGMSYEQLNAACTAAKVSGFGPTVDGDIIPDGTFEISKDIPLMTSNVLGEFSTNYANIPFAFTEENYQRLSFDNQTAETVLQSCIDKWGEEYGPKILDAFKAAYPTHNPAEVIYINNRYVGMSTLPQSQQMVSYGGTVYNALAAYSYPMYGGIVAIHTASDVPFWFGNVDDINAFVAGDEENAQKVNDAMAQALAAFARTGNPSTDTLAWEAYTPENGATMVFDADSQLKYSHDKELFELIQAAPQLQAGFSPF